MNEQPLFKTLHAAHLVCLNLLLFTPDIAQLESAARRGRDLRLFAIHTVRYLFTPERNKTGHLPVPGHLDGTFPAPDRSRRRRLSPGFCFIAILADSA